MNKTYLYRYRYRHVGLVLLIAGVVLLFIGFPYSLFHYWLGPPFLIISSLYCLLSKGTITISDTAIIIRWNLNYDKIVIKEITMIDCGDSFVIKTDGMYTIIGQRLSKGDYLEIEEYLNKLKVTYNV